MSESGDYVEQHWDTSRDFRTVRENYRRKAGSSMQQAVKEAKVLTDLVPNELVSKAARSLVLVFDETGSMGEAPKVLAEKWVYGQHEIHDAYIGAKGDIAICAVGDEFSDNYYLQVQTFRRGKGTEKSFEAMVYEGNGGGGCHESYGLPALYLARRASFPNAVRKPICIFFADEKPHQTVSVDGARSVRVDIRSSKTVQEVFRELRKSFEVYIVMRPYYSGGLDDTTNREIFRIWSELVGGDDRIGYLAQDGRVMDIIFGVLAKEFDKIDYFYKELEGRPQTPAQCEQVRRACRFLHADYFAEQEVSDSRKRKAKKPTKGLLDD